MTKTTKKRGKPQAQKPTGAPPAPAAARPSAKRAAQFQRLAQAIVASAQATEHADLSHPECEAALECYVDAERRGDTVRELYPAVWQHLHSCPRCSLSYLLVSEDYQAAAPTHLSAPHAASSYPLLPFITRTETQLSWTSHVRSRLGGAPLGFSFVVQPQLVQSVFASPSTAPSLRGPATESPGALLLADALSLGRCEVDVQVWASRSQDPSRIQLQVSVATSTALPDPLRVMLHWSDRTLDAPIHQGRALFEDIPLSDLQSAESLRIEFEAGV